MRMVDLIEKKRDGGVLSDEEIRFIIDGFTKGEIPDYQMSAWAMAVFYKGMTDHETAVLTDAMMRSAVRQEYPDTTLLLVAQRVSSVKNADQILVLEEGRMAGLGTHEALLRDCPLYAQIAKIQMGGDDDAAA